MSTTETTTPAAPEQAAASNLQIDVSVRPIPPQGKLYGYADITLGGEDGLKLYGFPIKVNKEGTLYTDMMGGYDKNGKWNEMSKPMSPAGYKVLNDAVLGQYQQEIENMRATLEATTQRQAPAQEGPAPEQAAKAPEPAAVQQGQRVKPTERPAAKQPEQAKPASLSDNLKKKAAQTKAQQPPTQKENARGGGELGA